MKQLHGLSLTRLILSLFHVISASLQMVVRVGFSTAVVAIFIGVIYFVAVVLKPPSDYLPYFENNDDWKT